MGRHRSACLRAGAFGRGGSPAPWPASSIANRTGTTSFGLILRILVSSRGVGILLIEHDMTLINDLCDSVHVVDFGHKIFEGTVAELAESEEVRRAYLGGTVASSDSAVSNG